MIPGTIDTSGAASGRNDRADDDSLSDCDEDMQIQRTAQVFAGREANDERSSSRRTAWRRRNRNSVRRESLSYSSTSSNATLLFKNDGNGISTNTPTGEHLYPRRQSQSGQSELQHREFLDGCGNSTRRGSAGASIKYTTTRRSFTGTAPSSITTPAATININPSGQTHLHSQHQQRPLGLSGTTSSETDSCLADEDTNSKGDSYTGMTGSSLPSLAATDATTSTVSGSENLYSQRRRSTGNSFPTSFHSLGSSKQTRRRSSLINAPHRSPSGNNHHTSTNANEMITDTEKEDLEIKQFSDALTEIHRLSGVGIRNSVCGNHRRESHASSSSFVSNNRSRKRRSHNDIAAAAAEVAEMFDISDDDDSDEGMGAGSGCTGGNGPMSRRNSARSINSFSEMNRLSIHDCDIEERPRKRLSASSSKPSLTSIQFPSNATVTTQDASTAQTNDNNSTICERDSVQSLRRDSFCPWKDSIITLPPIPGSNSSTMTAAAAAVAAAFVAEDVGRNNSIQGRDVCNTDDVNMMSSSNMSEHSKRRVGRRGGFIVSSIRAEAASAQASRMELLMKDRYEARKAKGTNSRPHARRSMSYTSGIKVRSSIISTSMPEEEQASNFELEQEENHDVQKLERSKMERRVLSLPDQNAILRLSQSSIRDNVDYEDEDESSEIPSSYQTVQAKAAYTALGNISSYQMQQQQQHTYPSQSMELPTFRRRSFTNSNNDSLTSNSFQPWNSHEKPHQFEISVPGNPFAVKNTPISTPSTATNVFDFGPAPNRSSFPFSASDGVHDTVSSNSNTKMHAPTSHSFTQGQTLPTPKSTPFSSTTMDQSVRSYNTGFSDGSTPIAHNQFPSVRGAGSTNTQPIPMNIYPAQTPPVQSIASKAAALSECLAQTAARNREVNIALLQAHLNHGSQLSASNINKYDTNAAPTNVEAVAKTPSTPEEQKASALLRKAIENHDPMISSYIRSVGDIATRLVLDSGNGTVLGDVALHIAVQSGSMVAVNTILEFDSDSAYIQNAEGYTPLHCAVSRGNFMAVSAICGKAAKCARIQCGEGCLPLHEAVSNAALHQDTPQITAVLLVAYPEAVHVTTDEGLLPVHLASMSGFAAGLRTIFGYIDAFYTINARESTEMMLPLDFAVDGLSNNATEDLPEQEQATAVGGQQEVLAVAHQQPEATQERTDVNSDFEGCIEILLSSTYYGRAVLAPRNNSDCPFLPIQGAITACPLERTWKSLLTKYDDFKSTVDYLNRTALHYLCTRNFEDKEMQESMMKDLVEAYPSACLQPDTYGFIPLHLAIVNTSISFGFIKELVRLCPKAVSKEVGEDGSGSENQFTKFYPFQIAAAIPQCSIDVLMYLMRSHPAGVKM